MALLEYRLLLFVQRLDSRKNLHRWGASVYFAWDGHITRNDVRNCLVAAFFKNVFRLLADVQRLVGHSLEVDTARVAVIARMHAMDNLVITILTTRIFFKNLFWNLLAELL